MAKPLVFSYKKYEDLREAYKVLLADNQKMAATNRELQKRLRNAEVKLRILEGDINKNGQEAMQEDFKSGDNIT